MSILVFIQRRSVDAAASVADSNLLFVPAVIILIVDRAILEPATWLRRRGRWWCVATITIGERATDDAAEKTGCDATGDDAAIVVMVVLVPRRRWRLAIPITVIPRWRSVVLLGLR
jgi:hypothetical protein